MLLDAEAYLAGFLLSGPCHRHLLIGFGAASLNLMLERERGDEIGREEVRETNMTTVYVLTNHVAVALLLMYQHTTLICL